MAVLKLNSSAAASVLILLYATSTPEQVKMCVLTACTIHNGVVCVHQLFQLGTLKYLTNEMNLVREARLLQVRNPIAMRFSA